MPEREFRMYVSSVAEAMNRLLLAKLSMKGGLLDQPQAVMQAETKRLFVQAIDLAVKGRGK